MGVETDTYERLYAANSGAAVTPGDTTIVSTYPLTRALYVGVGGNVNVILNDGTTVLLKNVPTGSFLPLSVKIIKSTSTTATDMVVFK